MPLLSSPGADILKVTQELTRFHILPLKIKIDLHTPLRYSEPPASLIRGALGKALYKKEARGFTHLVDETFRPHGNGPRPFMLSVRNITWKSIDVELTLFGVRAIRHCQHYIDALQSGRLHNSLFQSHPCRVQQAGGATKHLNPEAPHKDSFRLIEAISRPAPAALVFEHPFLIKEGGTPVRHSPSFSLLMRAALRRLRSLESTFGFGAPDDPASKEQRRALIHQAPEDAICHQSLAWNEQLRCRKEHRQALSGLQGRFTLAPSSKAWKPILNVLPFTGLGAKTSMGLGRPRLEGEL
jgi:hypothetical protein